MQTVKGILIILYVLICIAITVVVLMQEGKQAGLTGAISGAAESYWGKNKGRSMEGALERATKILGAVFIILTVVLNLSVFS